MEEGLRVELDDRNQTLGSKIRDAQIEKVPYMLIVGQKEQDLGKISLRLRDGRDLGQLDLKTFSSKVKGLVLTRSLSLW